MRPPQYAPARPASWPLTFDLESDVRVSCDVGYLCANFSLPRPLCSRLRPDVRDRQTDVRQTSDAHHRLMPPPNGGGGIISLVHLHLHHLPIQALTLYRAMSRHGWWSRAEKRHGIWKVKIRKIKSCSADKKRMRMRSGWSSRVPIWNCRVEGSRCLEVNGSIVGLYLGRTSDRTYRIYSRFACNEFLVFW